MRVGWGYLPENLIMGERLNFRFESLGTLFPGMPVGDGIANVPDFWKAEQTNFNASLLHFGNNLYWLGTYNRSGAGPGQTAFVALTPQQSFGLGAEEGHGYFDDRSGRFIWFGCVSGAPPPQDGVPHHGSGGLGRL